MWVRGGGCVGERGCVWVWVRGGGCVGMITTNKMFLCEYIFRKSLQVKAVLH